MIKSTTYRENWMLRDFNSTYDLQHAGDTTPPEIVIWKYLIGINGGTLSGSSEAIATALLLQMQSRSYYSKLFYLLPLLGSNFAAARIPLVNLLGVIPTNHSFVNADFSEAHGLQGDGSSKYLDTGYTISQFGSGNNGGMGYWENNYNSSTDEVIGSYDSGGTSRYAISVRSTRIFATWGRLGDGFPDINPGAGANGHYYNQSSSASSRVLYINGSSAASNTGTALRQGPGDLSVAILAAHENSGFAPSNTRCAVAYFTDGTLSAGEVTDLHNDLNNFLITPTGR